MPYVTESSKDPPRIFTVGKTGYPSGNTSVPSGRQRTQRGFRTIDLTPEDYVAITGKPSSYATELSFINMMDETSGDVSNIGYLQHDLRYWPCHERDYTETYYDPRGFTLVGDYSSYPYASPSRKSCQGLIAVQSVNTGTLPADPSTLIAQSRAGSMLRGSRPPVENFNLARFAAESRDSKLLMRLGNYIPRSPRDLGGAVLNFLFGLKPTGEDLGRGAALCLQASPIMSELIAQEKVVERRYNTSVLYEKTESSVSTLSSYDDTVAGSILSAPRHQTRIVYPGMNGSTSGFNNVLLPIVSHTSVVTQTLRTFATWEYFVPRPLGLEERMPAYQRAATYLLKNAKLDASDVYDLTPWTWLGNWFVDFGGLLRYQQAIVDNQQVMTNSGYTILTKYVGTSTYERPLPSQYNGIPPYTKGVVRSFTPATASVKQLRITRRPCSPYAVGPTWNLSTLQWGILGALGLSRGPGLPNIIS